MPDNTQIQPVESRISSPNEINILGILRCDIVTIESKRDIFSYPIDYPEIYIRNNFISGHLRTQGKGEGAYPIPYLQMISDVFGKEPETIEVCSRHVKADGISTGFTVDVNQKFNPSLVTDGQTLAGIENNRFKRWRCDPPYNAETAYKMYGVKLPSFYRLLEAGARVCQTNSLMFLLLGPTNWQICPPGIKRIGVIFLTVVPNNEIRCCNIFYKYEDVSASGQGYQSQLEL